MHLARLPLPRPAARAAIRHLSTRSPPPPPPPHQPQPTSFTAKASPRQTLSHPEEIRGMPPLSPRDAVNKGKADTVTVGERGKGRDGKEVFEAFEGPSKPRLIYERPGGRELPKVRVSRGLGAWHNARRLTMMCVCRERRLSVRKFIFGDLSEKERELTDSGAVIALGLLGLGWGLFILHATNSGNCRIYLASTIS